MANDVSLTAALSLAAYLMDLVAGAHPQSARRHDQRSRAGRGRRGWPNPAADGGRDHQVRHPPLHRRHRDGGQAARQRRRRAGRSPRSTRPIWWRIRRCIPGAVEELLRFEAPSPVNGRWTTADVVHHGVEIPKDSKVLLLDRQRGTRRARLSPTPTASTCTARGRTCRSGMASTSVLGAALARLEGRVALEETLARFPAWQVDPDGLERVHTSTVRGYQAVPDRDMRPSAPHHLPKGLLE